jgi:hypothetical protein
VDKESIFRALYPDRGYDDGVIRYLFSDLLKLGLQFIKVNSPDHMAQEMELLGNLSKRGLMMLYRKQLKSIEEELSGQTINDVYFFNKLVLEAIQMNHNMVNDLKLEKVDNPAKSNEYIISFFLIRFFRINYNLTIQKYNFDFTPNHNLINSLIEFVEQNSFEHKDNILIYYNMLMTVLSDDISYYYTLKKLVFKNFDSLGIIERFNMYAVLQNYCLQRTMRGDAALYTELFDIYTSMLENNVYLYGEHSFMPPQLFRNMATTASRLGKFEWAENFIRDYIDKVNPEFRENILNFSLSSIYMYKKQFGTALEYLSKIKFDSVLDKPVVRTMLLKIHYEMDSTEAVFAMIDSSRHFISNDKLISKERKELFANFITAFNDLLKCKERPGDTDKLALSKKEAEKAPMLEKEWILEKYNELTPEPPEYKVTNLNTRRTGRIRR